MYVNIENKSILLCGAEFSSGSVVVVCDFLLESIIRCLLHRCGINGMGGNYKGVGGIYRAKKAVISTL